MSRASGGSVPVSSSRWTIDCSIGATRMSIGILTTNATNAPARPASRPTSAPSPGVIGVAWFCWKRYAATRPPLTTHRQQQAFPIEMIGSADSTPITTPPISAGCVKFDLVVVLTAQVRNELLTFEVAECVLQLHELNEEVVLGIETGRVHRALEVERQPFLDAVHVRALGQVHEQGDVEDDRRG